MPDGCGVFVGTWRTDAKRKFQDLLQTGAQTFGIVRFSVQGDRIIPSTGGGGGRYVGYPMGYWCEFAPAYGFHQGFVHPTPRTHGCIRLHGEAAPKFFALVQIGTPVDIATTQPEDATLASKVQRVDDSRTARSRSANNDQRRCVRKTERTAASIAGCGALPPPVVRVMLSDAKDPASSGMAIPLDEILHRTEAGFFAALRMTTMT